VIRNGIIKIVSNHLLETHSYVKTVQLINYNAQKRLIN